jgi:IPT/TIG domain
MYHNRVCTGSYRNEDVLAPVKSFRGKIFFSLLLFTAIALLTSCQTSLAQPQLTLTGVSPTSGSTAGGTNVTLSGSGFASGV